MTSTALPKTMEIDKMDGFSEECGRPCEAEREDAGFFYEAGGYRGNAMRWAFVSDCCEAGVLEEPK